MKFIRVNMSIKTIRVEDVPEECVGLRGRSLTPIMADKSPPRRRNESQA